MNSRFTNATRVVLLAFLLALPAAAQALDYTFTTSNGMITITGYTGVDGNVTLPGTINGLPVTSIGQGAFANRPSLNSITVPNSVTNIGDGAFANCTGLTSVTIPSSVTIIGYQSFYSCIGLTNVTFPNSVTSIGHQAFYFCTSLTTVTIPNSVTNIGNQAWCLCRNLTVITVDALNSAYSSVDGVLFNKSQTALLQYPGGKAGAYTISNSVTNIGDFAFAGGTNLTSVTIPSSVLGIGGGAFVSCISLASVTIPASVTDIRDVAFGSCTKLTAITVDALNSAYSSVDGVLFNKSQTTLIQCPGGKAGSYTIPNNVTSMGDGAFIACTSLTSVTIGNSVNSISHHAFYFCTNLNNVTIGNSVTNIRDSAFNFCLSLASITIPGSVVGIGQGAFISCPNLTGIYFNGNAPSLGADVFFGNTRVVVYRLSETLGWIATFGGRPTTLWNLLVQTGSPSFGVRTNQFGFNIAWASGKAVVVEACTNLVDAIWFPLQTNTLSGGSFYFSDPQWANFPGRFYRLRSP